MGQFPFTGLSFEVILGKATAKKAAKSKTNESNVIDAAAYDLVIDGHSFAKIHSDMVEKTRAAHALAQPPTAEEMLQPTIDNHVAPQQKDDAKNAETKTKTRKSGRKKSGRKCNIAEKEATAKKGDMRVSNSSARVEVGDVLVDTAPDCLNVQMSQGLEENRMHSEHSADLDLDLDPQTRPEIQYTEQKMSTFIGTTRSAKITTTTTAATNTMKKQHGKNSRSSWSTSQKKLDIRSGPEIIISGLETLGHHDDFYNTDSDLLSRPSGSFSFASSTSTQFNSALSHFDSSTSTSAMVDVLSPSQDRLNPNPASTPPPSSFTSPAGSGSTIPLAECVISP